MANKTVQKAAAKQGVLNRKVMSAPGLSYGDQQAALYLKNNLVYDASRCSPRGETEEERIKDWEKNMDRAMEACRFTAYLGFIPIAPHLYFSFLDDQNPRERSMGLEMGKSLLRMCSAMWIWGYEGPDSLSEGMRSEIRFCKTHAIPMKCFPEPTEFFDLVNENVKGMSDVDAVKYLRDIIAQSVYVPGAAQAPVYDLIKEDAKDE